MDLPPFRHQHHHHPRYGNILHPPDFIPPPCNYHLPPPPPQHRPPNILLPPPPPPPWPVSPPRDIIHPLIRPRFAFSPPIIERPHHHEFEPQPKPYFHRNYPPLPSPPPQRENMRLRVIPDYPERNPMLNDEIVRRGCSDGYPHELHENWDQNMHCRAREVRERVPDIGDHERYRDMISHSRELYRRMDDGEGIRDNRVNEWCHDLYNKGDYDERRWGSGISARGRELFDERDYDERRLDSCMNGRGHELFYDRDYGERRWESNMNDRNCELYNKKDYNERSWDSVMKERGGELYTEVDHDERRLIYGSNDGVLLRSENRQLEFVDEDLSLGRFIGRLGERVCEEEVIGSKKKRRLQKKSALHRFQSGKNCSRHSGADKQLHFTKKLSSDNFRGKEKEGYEWFQTRVEDKREREQSPVELAISFKSNSMVAKAILAPSRPVVKSDIDSTKVNNRSMCNTFDSPSAKSSNGVVKTNCLIRGLDLLLSKSQRTSTELLDKSLVSGSGRVTANGTYDLGQNAVKNELLKDVVLQGPTIVGAGKSGASRSRKKKRAGKRLSCKTNLQKKKESGNISNTNHHINSLSVVPQFNVDTTLSNGNLSSASVVVHDTVLFPPLGGIDSESGGSKGDSYKPFFPNLKRKKSSLNTLSASSFLADNLITRCSGRAESSVTIIGEADDVCQLGIDEVAGRARETFLANEDSGLQDSLSFNQPANSVKKFVQNGTPVLHTEKSAIWCPGQYTRLGTASLDDNSERTLQYGTRLLENSFVKGLPMVSIKGHDTSCSSRPQETRVPEVQEDEYFSEIQKTNSSLDPDVRLLQKSKRVAISDLGSADANLEFSPAQFNIPRVGVDAEELRSSDGAVKDCSNVGLGISTRSSVPSAEHKGVVSQFGVSFADALSKRSFINVNCLEGSPKAISNVKTCSSMDYSSKIIRKRKARGAQTSLPSPSTNVLVGTVRSIGGGEVARRLANNFVPDLEVDFLGEKDTCIEDDCLNKGLSEAEDTTLEVDFGANGSYPGYRKKRKVASPRSNLFSLSEDDTVADGVTIGCSEFVLGSAKLAELAAEQREDSPTASTINRCGINNVEGKVGLENFYVADLDKNVADVNKRHVNGVLALIANNLPFCADRNAVSASNSDEELLSSSFDMRACMSSPEKLLSYSDLSFSRYTAHQSENEVVRGRENTSNRKPVLADPSILSLEKSLKNAASDNSQANAKLSPSLPEDYNKVVKKSNLLHGKLTLSNNQPTVPKIFPGHHTSNFSNSRKFHSTHAKKSRTWCRTGNSVTVTEPKSQPPPVPPSHGTKTAGTIQSSYIRKGNSLVRNPSLPGVTPPGLHGSRSVHRPTPCTDNLTNSQAYDNKTDDANAPTLLVNTSELPKALPLNHTGISLKCSLFNLGESLPAADPPRNGCPYKTLDGLGEPMMYSAVPECQTDSVTNSDNQSTLEEGNFEKKILYVKRRSYQLVAASNDLSIVVADKTQASLSDSYFKSRKNQLVRASSENQVKKGDADVKSQLVPQTNLPRTSNRRVSGFGKSYRSSKLSFVWKLHEPQSSEKHKNFVVPRKVWPHLFPWKRASHWRSFMHALGAKPNSTSFSSTSQKLLLPRKRGAMYTRSTHGNSLRMSKVLSVGGSSLKWSKSLERNSKKASEDATRAVAAAEKRNKEERGAIPTASKSRNHVSRKLVLNVKLRPGHRIFRIGSERYKMDPTRRTLHRITAEKEPSSSVVLQSEKNVKRSYVPRRLLIGNEEYVQIGNGNQLVRDPKKRTRVLASEKVRWSLRTARLKLARKRKYCQFFTRFGKCNKDDGKCPYIHDPSKIVVCTKFLSGSCSNLDCKLTHKVIPERMQDCSYFLKGSCSNENCPYRHVNVDPDSSVCRSFLRGYCADGNKCRKKHTFACPDFEATGICPHGSTCKLHHPKKKIEPKPKSEQKIVRGRYFDGGLIGDPDCSMGTPKKRSAKGKDNIVCHEGNFPDYISLDISDEEVEHTLASEQASDDILSDLEIADRDELIQPSLIMDIDSLKDSSPALDSQDEMNSLLF